MPPNRTGGDEQWIGKASGEGNGGYGAQHQCGARSPPGADGGTEDDDDCFRSIQQVTGRPVSADVTSASNAVMVASISSVEIG